MAKMIGLYGSVKLQRGYCGRCKDYAFVFDNILECCDSKIDVGIKKQKRMCGGSKFRKSPSTKERKEILEKQDNKCLYCQLEFPITFTNERKSKVTMLNPCWDHRIPYAYSQNNNKQNFVASCSICNLIKSDNLFETLEDARSYVEHRRKKKGYSGKENSVVLSV